MSSRRSTLASIATALGALLLAACAAPPLERGSSFPAGDGTLPTTDGLEIHYRIEGAGPELVVAVHGGPGFDLEVLAPDLEPLAAQRTVVYYDQRGGGSSTIVTDAALLRADDHVADLEALRVRLGRERLTLLGHSWGAGLVALYAMRHPEHVERLVLVAPMPPRQSPYMEQFEANVVGWMDDATLAELERLEAVSASVANSADVTEIAAACRAVWALLARGYMSDPHHPPAFRADLCAGSRESLLNRDAVYAATIESLGAWDWTTALRAVEAPALIIHGGGDPIPIEAAREWQAALPNATLAVLEAGGHFPYIERPAEFYAVVERFLAR